MKCMGQERARHHRRCCWDDRYAFNLASEAGDIPKLDNACLA